MFCNKKFACVSQMNEDKLKIESTKDTCANNHLTLKLISTYFLLCRKNSCASEEERKLKIKGQ